MSKRKDPAFLFYSQDFFVDTALWDDGEVGRYIRLLCLQHMNGPFDPIEFEKMTQPHDLKIRSKFVTNDLGQFFNEKLEEIREQRNEFISKQRENGKKGGRPKKPNKSQSQSQTKPKDNPTVKPNINPNITMRVENENEVIKEVFSTKENIKDLNDLKDIGQNELTDTSEENKSTSDVFFSTIKIDGKDRPDPEDPNHPFNIFWEHYPRRVKRIEAEKSFKRNVKKWDTLSAIIRNILIRESSGDWNPKDAHYRKFIPHPTTYLNNQMWTDEIKSAADLELENLSEEEKRRLDQKVSELTGGIEHDE